MPRKNHSSKKAPAFILALGAALLFAGSPARTDETGAKMTIGRIMDQVVIQGSRLEATDGTEIGSLRLMAFKDGAAQCVPFQIDEKTKAGDYVMERPNGKKDKDDGKLDANDELVFMAHDAGDKGDPASSLENVSAVSEVCLKDPRNGASGWAYLVAFSADPPPLSSVSYMKYEEKKNYDELTTPYYVLHFPKNNVFISDIIITPEAGGNGKDIMDRIKMRSGLSALGGVVEIERNEDDFVHEILGVSRGPVRIIRQTSTRIVLLLSLKSPSVIVNGSFYPCSFEFPSMLSLPFRMDMVASDAFIRQGWDLTLNAKGLKFYTSINPDKPVIMDGKMSPEEEELAKSRDTLQWALGTGETGTFLFKGVWDESSPISALLYYEDDLERLEPPEEVPGVMGFAYRLEDLLKMGGEEYPFNIVNYVVPNFNGDIDDALAVFDHPLEVKVKN